MNPYKNEKLIKFGEVEILLRPTFENIAAFESSVITLDEFSIRLVKGKTPGLAVLVQAIYFFQAEKKYNLEQINQMLQDSIGIQVNAQVLPFLGSVTAGHQSQLDVKNSVDKILSAEEKKS